MPLTTPPLIWEAIKDPNDEKDYQVNWSRRLIDKTIVASEWFIMGGKELVISSQSYGTQITTIYLTGGRVGTHTLLNRITDNSVPARKYDQTVKLYVREK